MIGVVSVEGMMFFLAGIVSWAIVIGAGLFLLWTLYLANKYLRVRLRQLRAEQEPVHQDP